MKKYLFITVFSVVAALMVSCYGIPDEEFATLSDLEITANELVQVKQSAELHMDIDVKSDLDVTYEWSYGPVAQTGFPNMSTSTVIGNTRTLDYSFTKPGEYVLRLKADNGEKIVFKYFRLQVQTGYDEGILILNNDDAGNGQLTFIKQRTEEEIANNEQEIWDDVFTEVNPDFSITNGSGLFLSRYVKSSVLYSSLLIGCLDEQGTIYKLNPQTLELYTTSKMSQEYPGSKPQYFVGEYSGSADYYCFVFSPNGGFYRYDMYADIPQERTESVVPFTHCYEGYYATSKKRYPFLYSDKQIITVSSSLKTYNVPDGKEILNMAYIRTSTTMLNVILRSTENPREISTVNMSSTLSSVTNGASWTATEDVAMDKNSIMLTTDANQYAYYNYNNKIYRWDVTNRSNVNFSLPGVNDYQKYNGTSIIPEGEEICSMCTKLSPYTGDSDTWLIVATYNPNRAGDKKGSVYVFDLTDNSLVKKYEGVCYKPVQVLYKFVI